MMIRLLILFCCLIYMTGCSSTASVWRLRALEISQELDKTGGEHMFPSGFSSMRTALNKAEALFRESKFEEADNYYLLVLGKGDILARQIDAEKNRLDTEKRLLTQKSMQKTEKPLETLKPAIEEHPPPVRIEKPKPAKDRPLITTYTVKRGETLPQISARQDIYNDNSLWPLIYRANRDQIRDPKRIWPGQVLRIPRNVSREDMAEARRYSQDR